MNLIDGHSVAIVTKYYAPTNSRGERVVARRSDHQPGDPTVTHHWDYSLDRYDNHLQAARELIEALDWADSDWVAGSMPEGIVCVRVPRNHGGAS